MMGRNHIISGIALGLGGLGTLYAVSHIGSFVAQREWHWLVQDVLAPISQWISEGAFFVRSYISNGFDDHMVVSQYMNNGELSWSAIVFFIGAVLLYLIGLLLPDIDSPRSLLGRFFPSMGPHRSWTHTDWVPLALIALSTVPVLRILVWLALGVVAHDAVDGWSRGGRVRFWPLGQWELINGDDGSAIVVRSQPRGVTYRVGYVSEYIALAIFVTLGIGGILLGYASELWL